MAMPVARLVAGVEIATQRIQPAFVLRNRNPEFERLPHVADVRVAEGIDFIQARPAQLLGAGRFEFLENALQSVFFRVFESHETRPDVFLHGVRHEEAHGGEVPWKARHNDARHGEFPRYQGGV